MSQLISKAFAVVKRHKKKAISTVVLTAAYSILQYSRKTKKFEETLNKLEKRVQVQIEKEFKDRAELLRKNANYEEIYAYFLGLDKMLKRNLKQEINSLFQFEVIMASLRKSDLAPEDKKRTWNTLKEETFIQTALAIVYIPMSRVILFLRECLINSQESLAEQDNSDDYRSLEAFLTDLLELIVKDGGKELYRYIKQQLAPINAGYDVLKRYKKDQILDLVDTLKDKLLAFDVEDEEYVASNNEPAKARRSIEDILVKRNKREKAKGKKVINKWKELSFPKFTLKVLSVFTSIVSNMKVSENRAEVTEYCVKKNEQKDDSSMIWDDQELKRELLARTGSRDGSRNDSRSESRMDSEAGDKEDPLLVRHDCNMEEAKNVNEVKDKEVVDKIKIIQECGNEFLDLLESGNLSLLLLYMVGGEFEKLKNRITLYYSSKAGNMPEGVALAKFLPVLQKIMQEEFISEESEEVNENFYNAKIKASLGYLRNKEASDEEMELSNKILEEAEMRKEVNNALKEFGKKIYLGKSYEKVQKNEGSGDSNGLELLLNGLTKTNLGGQAAIE